MRQKRILISRPDRIGDVVLSTPIPRAIKKQFPGSFVAILLRSYTKDIYFNNPYVDKIITYENNSDSFIEKLKEIRNYKFTHALMLLPNERINYMLFLAGIKTRVGVGHKLFQFLTFSKYVDRKKYIPLRHEADYCMDLARKIGVKSDNLDTEIFLSEEERKKVCLIRKDFAPQTEFIIGVHSSSGNSSPNWKPSEYKTLLHKLKTVDNTKIVVTDNNVPDELKNIAGVSYPNSKKNLRESILNFAALDLLISASTGPMHIAAALKVKTLSMFCPLTACSPELWGPRGNKSYIVLPEDNYCNNHCPGDPKNCTFSGNGGIDSLKILNEVRRIL